MRWLWPEADNDENNLITLANPPPSGEVNFFAKMNGGTDWTDGGLLSSTWIRAVHTNEFRWACERLSRGRWKMPIYFSAGIIHHTQYNLDDTPWIGGLIAKSVWGDLRTIGFAQVSTADSPKRGLWNVQVRPTSRIWLVCDADCTVEVGRVTTNPISYVSNPPTWNNAQPGVLPWNTPGGDFQPIGTMTMVAGVPNSLTGQAVADALQTMVDAGSHFDGDTSTCSFLVRKVSDSFDNVATSGSIDVDFDLMP